MKVNENKTCLVLPPMKRHAAILTNPSFKEHGGWG